MQRIIPLSSMEIRQEWLKKLGGLSSISVKNKEWIALLEEETRHSLMIEGHVVSKQELRQILEGGQKRSNHSTAEVLAYFEAAISGYEFAFQQFKEGEFQISKPVVRQLHALMFRGVENFSYQPGDWRRGPIKIAQARVEAPLANKVERLMDKLLTLVNKFDTHPVRKAAMFHSFFEQIHPFPDGNGRVGRILLNYVLIAHGLPNVAIKGLKIERDEYFASLESSDDFVLSVLQGKRRWSAAKNKPFIRLENLINKNLAIALDTIICTRFQENKYPLLPIRKVAQHSKMSLDSFRTACSQHKHIAIKVDGRLLSHPNLLHKPT